MDAVQSFKKTIQRHRLFAKTDKLLVAFSGGSDSTALCHICHGLGYKIGLAHVNFRLREDDSEGDADFVEAKANALGIDLHLKSIDCKKYAKEHQLSIQEAARNIRYDFFETIKEMHGYDHVLTAHHAKDNAETMIYTLSKGASMKALRGIPLSRGFVVRPLLYTTKAAIDLYLKRHGITFRHDISNDDPKYRRNYIRKELLPLLEQINPNLEGTLSHTSILGGSYDHLIDDLLAGEKKEFQKTGRLNLQPKSDAPTRFAWLYELINPFGFNFKDSLDIWDTLAGEHSTGKTFKNTNHLLTIDRGFLVFSALNSDADDKSFIIHSIETARSDSNGQFSFELLDHQPVRKGVYLDYSKIKFPLLLRTWEPGDRFKPSGMNGKSKKVKDYLTDIKISGPKKRSVKVLVSAEDIIWVVGYRLAHGYTIDDKSKSVLSIELY